MEILNPLPEDLSPLLEVQMMNHRPIYIGSEKQVVALDNHDDGNQKQENGLHGLRFKEN